MCAETVKVAEVHAGVWRRFGAMLYDLLLVLALIMLLTAAFLPFTGGEALSATRMPLTATLYNLARLGVVIGFFGLFWTRQGQTLGMMAWRLKIKKTDGSRLTWPDALRRLAAALVSLLPLGLGYFWIWLDRDGLAWPDRWTRTRIVVVQKT